jgi:hypothetical protein
MRSLARPISIALSALICLAAPSAAQGTSTAAPPSLPATDSIFKRARRLVSDGNGPAGRAIVDSMLRASPEGTPPYGDALFWRGALAETAADAERDYRRVVVEYPLSPYVDDALLSLAELEQARGDREAAFQHLQRFVREHPASPARARAGLAAARLAFEQRDVTHGCSMIADARASVGGSDVELRNQIEYYGARCPTTNVASGTSATGTATAPTSTTTSQASAASAPTASAPPPISAAVPPAAKSSQGTAKGTATETMSAAPNASVGAKPTTSTTRSTGRATTTTTRAPSTKPSSAATSGATREVEAPKPAATEPAPPTKAPEKAPATESERPKPASAAPRGIWTIQLAAYNTRPEAERLVKTLASRGVHARVSGETKPFRVRLDYYPTRQAAAAAVADLKKRGIIGFVTDEPRPSGATSP